MNMRTVCFFVLLFVLHFSCQKEGEDSGTGLVGEDEPVKYVGNEQPDPRFYDGRLRHAVGVHHYQVFRANRSEPLPGERFGWTYNHQPFLAYWNDTFYIQHLSDLYQEHTPPGRTLILTSKDGRNWSDPVVVFPEYTLPEINYEDIHIPAGTKAVMHQRMGFYVAPNGRLLTLAFYSYCATPRSSPNAGNGLGRVVREIYKDGRFGPIYFIRYNRHAGWNESNTNYPFYKTSPDTGFVAACEALLADKLVTLQWWEEDRGKDGFYVIHPGEVENAAYFSHKITTSKGAGKAFSFFHRADGVVVGLWKNQYSALSPDDGKTWTKITRNTTLWTDGAKTWGQRTDDGRYAIVHNQSATHRNRFPMTVMTSEDGHLFDNLLCLRGEVPPKRYQALHKRIGPQYYRGIIEGNGNPPGDHMWITYSVNKEDIWIARIKVPIAGEVEQHVQQDFEGLGDISELEDWNVYVLKWAGVSIADDPVKPGNRCLQLRDEDPHDYAKAERIFPRSKQVRVAFRVNPLYVPRGRALEIEVKDQRGNRPMRLRLDGEWLNLDLGRTKVNSARPVETGKWYDVVLDLNAETQSYAITVNGEVLAEQVPFDEEVAALERIEFRTGPYRGLVSPLIVNRPLATAGYETEDLAGADERVPASVFLIDDFSTASPR